MGALKRSDAREAKKRESMKIKSGGKNQNKKR
jgi:hypothetical protein